MSLNRPWSRGIPKAARILIALALLQSIPAFACSVREGYRIPTNLELVRKADLIVLGRIVSGPDESSSLEPEVLIEPIRILKGERPSAPLKVIGSVRWNGLDIPALPSPLASAHFSVGMGACVRIFYPKGGWVVAMFGTDPEGRAGMVQLFEPFARIVEDVESPDGVWVKAVEAYMELLERAPPDALSPAIEAKRDRLLADRSSLASQAIAADLDDHLRRTGPPPPPPSKPYWRMADGPMDSAAGVRIEGTEDAVILYCKSGAQALDVQLLGRRKPGQIEIRIGETAFAVEGEAVRTQEIEGKRKPVLAGSLPLTDTLSSALWTNASDVGVRIDGRPGPGAPPLDVLRKFALRCSALLQPRR